MANQTYIEDIIKAHLCTGCGTCIGLCPNNALELIVHKKKKIYLPKIDKEKCTSCGTCNKICPGPPFKYKNLNFEIFKKESSNFLIGNYKNCYIGNSKNELIRYNSASGGLITQLLIFALKQKIINGALITRMKDNNPLEPEPFIARTKEEIIKASKSKYCPVPVNIMLKKIHESKKNEKFAIVGLPCQIHGVRMAEKLFKDLKEKIILHFGIFCSHTLNFNGTNFLLKNLGIKMNDVIQIDYRGEGWPGKMKIKLRNNKQKLIPNNSSSWENIFHSGLFVPMRCLICNDLTSELSDISFGDAWLPEFVKEDHVGRSIIITRNKLGDNLLKNAYSSGYIDLLETNKEKVIQSQKLFLYIKKNQYIRENSIIKIYWNITN